MPAVVRRRLSRFFPLACPAAVAVAAVPQPAGAQSAPKYLNKQYSDAVHDLRGCLDTLSATNRKLVVLRSGIGPADPQSGAQVAAALNVPAASVGRRQWAAVRDMRSAEKAGSCSGAGG